MQELSDDRNKVDIRSNKTLNPQHMDAPIILHSRKRDTIQSLSGCDLRKSLAWDSAFFTSPGVLDPEELLETLNFKVGDNGADITGHVEPKSLPFESTLTPTNVIDSLRKSLAWDSAFFTSAGVLDAEELSIINRGFRRPETLPFPSSIDGWSSESSSTSIKQRSNSSAASPVSTPFREISFDIGSPKASDSERHRYGQTLGHEIQETKLLNPQFNNVSMCKSTVSPNISRKPRPSSLRMPSPKIGFFDAENSAALAQNGGLKFHSGVQGASSKNKGGINNASELVNRTRYGKHRLAGTSTGPQ
ncbi:hypothetical protein GH714_009242 [Hevea brasiliensis]|uniref:Uncharacterized protein n=1 Tax=Hevea brasiliensis TaxID=3981 RepID=A0A6A6MZQ0_HEVBR|nr:hypothetical protein GH714_009242 [Hevea brasiliensis]